MPMTINFYNEKKRINSTKKPSGGVGTIAELKEGCDLYNPVFIVRGNYLNYTMMGYEGFYYYITGQKWVNGNWEVSGTIDPLATWRDDIRDHTDFIVRCSDSEEPQVFEDPACVAQSTVMVADNKVGEIPAFGGDGAYIVTIGGRGGADGGAYYVPTADLQTVIDSINGLSGTTAWKDNMGAPMDYVRDIRFVPKAVPGGITYNSVYVGAVEAQLQTPVYNAPSMSITGTWFTKYLHAHPQAQTVGTWLNESPYSLRRISHPIIGDIDVDRLRETVVCNYRIDNRTGDCAFTVSSNDGIIISQRTCNLSASVFVGGVANPSFGTMLNTVGNLCAGVVSMATGNVTGGIMSIVGTAINASQNCAPRYISNGSNGGWNLYGATGTFSEQFVRVVPPNYSDFGKPYMKSGTVGDHTGFVKVSYGDISTKAPEPFKSYISSALKGGIYFE